MVCKKEVIAWFCDLSVYRRIDFLCALMDCCTPLELRFLGTYVESLGRRDYDRLRESELHANDMSYLSKLTNITDIRILDKVLTSLALMNSRCTDGARVLYRTLKEHTDAILSNGVRTRDPHTETDEKVVLLAVMALNHPAFTFSQKQALRSQLSALLQAVEGRVSPEVDEMELNPQEIMEVVPAKDIKEQHLSASNSSPDNNVVDQMNYTREQPTVYVKAIEVKGLKNRQSDKRLEYTFQVHWSDCTVSCISKTHAQLFDFQCKLVQLFPEEANTEQHQDRVIPYIPGKRIFSVTPPGEQGEKTQAEIVEYAKQLSALPQHILQCDHFVNFFRTNSNDANHSTNVINSGSHCNVLPTLQSSDKPKQLLQAPPPQVGQVEVSKQVDQSVTIVPKSSVYPIPVQQPLPPHAVQHTIQQLPSIHLRHPQPHQFPNMHIQQQQHQQHVKGHVSPHPQMPQHAHLQLQSHAHIQLQQQQQAQQQHQQQHPQHHHVQLLNQGSAQLQQQQQQQLHPPPPSTPTHNLTASVSQLHISQHHQVNVPAPLQSGNNGGSGDGNAGNSGGGSSLSMPSNNNSIVTSTVTTTSAGANSVYYQTLSTSMVFVPTPQEHYTSASNNAEPVPASQQSYKSAGTKVQVKPSQNWPQSYTPPLNPPTHSAPLFSSSASKTHVCISPLQSPNFRYPTPLNSPQGGMPPHSRDMVTPIIHEWLKKQRLHKYAYLFEGMTVEQVLQLTDEQIDHWNIVKGAKGRIKTQLEQLRRNDLHGFNGLTPQSLAMHPALQGNPGFFIPQPPPGSTGLSVLSQIPQVPSLFLQQRQIGEGTGSECSSGPSSPRESSDENDRDSEESESSATSCSDAIQSQAKRKEGPNRQPSPQQISPRDIAAATKNAPRSPQPSITSLPYSQVVKSVGVDTSRQGDRSPRPQGDMRLPNAPPHSGSSSPLMPASNDASQQQQQQQRMNAVQPHPPVPSNTATMNKQLPQVVTPDGSIPQMHPLENAIHAAATPHLFHIKQHSNKQGLHTVQYVPGDVEGGGGYRTSKVVVQQGSGASPSPPAPAGTMQPRGDNVPVPVLAQHPTPQDHHIATTTKNIYSPGSMPLLPNPVHSLPLPTTDGYIAPTSVTYVTTPTHSLSVGIGGSNNLDGSTTASFNNNQPGYNGCTSCGCSGHCGQANHHTTTSASNSSSNSTSSSHHIQFNHPTYHANPGHMNFPNFYHQGNIMPPTPNSMLSPPPNLPTNSPRFHAPMPPSPLQGALPEMLYGGNAQFGMLPHGAPMYLGGLGMGHRGGHGHHSGGGSKKGHMTCFNCGGQGHRASECREATMESITHNSHYRLNYKAQSSDVIDNTDS